jgi:hypothetical protein
MPIRRTTILAGSSLVAVLLLGCGHEWDAYDPRLGAEGPDAGGGSSSSVGGGGSASSGAGIGGSGGVGGTVASSSGSGGGSPCALSLQNEFDDGTVEGGPWISYASGDVSVVEADGFLDILMPSMSAQNVWGSFQTVDRYDMSGCGISARVLEIPNTATNAYTNLTVHVDFNNYVEIASMQGNLLFKYVTNGVNNSTLQVVKHDLGKHAFWRIREEAGTTYWETSMDGQTWVEEVSAPNPLPVTNMLVRLGAGTVSPVTQVIGKARWDDLKVETPL